MQPQPEHLRGVRAVEDTPGEPVHEHPRGCSSTNPSAQMQWNATGSGEDERDRAAPAVDRRRPTRGAAPARGSRPHIHSAVSELDDQQDEPRRCVSQAFICSMPEKPRVNSGR